jgi:arylsulfatase A-like enzyme
MRAFCRNPALGALARELGALARELGALARELGAFARVLGAFAPALAALALAPGCGGNAPRHPSVILITLDTVRADYLGCYGAAVRTPGIDAFAAEGVRFSDALSTSAVTPVSHASILTGLDPYHHGLRVLSAEGGFRLRDAPTLASHLKRAGYATGAVHSAFPVSGHFGFDRDFDHFDSFELDSDEPIRKWPLDELQRRSDETTDRALAFVRSARQPFFLWIHYWDPHDERILPPPEFMARVAPGKDWSNPSMDEVYAVEMLYLDQQFGRLISTLKREGFYDDAIVVLTSDHGQGLADGVELHDWRFHRMLYQEQIHVPLVFRAPGNAAGVAIEGLVSTTDVVPTVLDLAGIEPGAAFDGRSLRPLMEGEPYAERIVYADQLNGYDFNAKTLAAKPRGAFMYCVARGDWKLTYRPNAPQLSELFNLRLDPDEQDNLFDRDHVVRNELLEELARRNPWVLAPFPPDSRASAGTSASAAAALAELGYEGDGETDDVAWAWTCPAHNDLRADRPGRHEGCGTLLIPVAVP